MFKFLKEKLKGVVDSIKKGVEDEVEVEEITKEIEPSVPKKEPSKKKKEIKKEPIIKKNDKKVSKPKKVPEPKESVQESETIIISEEKVEEKNDDNNHVSLEKKSVKEEPLPEEVKEKKSFFGKIFSKKEEKVEEPQEEIIEETKEIVDEKSVLQEEKKGLFSKITETVTKFNLSEEKFNDIFWELEIILLENNVAVEVIEKIKQDLKEELTTGKVSRKGVEEVIRDSLKKSIEEVLNVESYDFLDKVKSKKPFVIVFIGVNGSGKTTNMAKVANYLQKNGLSVVFAASDTFRAAAIHQLGEHAENLKIKMIKHDYNADPAAVAFDAIEHAKAKGIDVVMIDTAGRLHSNTNLMEELKKLIRVNKPDMKIFVGESITGNDCVEQASTYNDAVGIDGIILSKADVDEKGGAAISVSYITKKPILFIGTGQTYDDIKLFDKKIVLESLDL